MVKYYRAINLMGFVLVAIGIMYVLIGLGNPLALLGMYLFQPVISPELFEGANAPEEEPEKESAIGFTAEL